MRVQHRHLRGPVERRLAGERLVEHATERVDVGARVHLPALDLLGRAVLDRPDEGAGPRQPGRRELLDRTEVGEVSAVARADEDVRGLHVAVDEPACVRRVERGCDLAHNRERPPHGQRALVGDQRLQVGALDAGHRDPEQAVVLARVVDRDDVRVVERGREPGLAQEAVAEVGVAEARREELQRGPAAEAHVLGAVDDACAAAAELLDDPIAAELGADALVEFHPHQF